MSKPARPRILRDIDTAVAAALAGIPGVFFYTQAGVDMAAGMNVILRVTVDRRRQRVLGRWVAKTMGRKR